MELKVCWGEIKQHAGIVLEHLGGSCWLVQSEMHIWQLQHPVTKVLTLPCLELCNVKQHDKLHFQSQIFSLLASVLLPAKPENDCPVGGVSSSYQPNSNITK